MLYVQLQNSTFQTCHLTFCVWCCLMNQKLISAHSYNFAKVPFKNSASSFYSIISCQVSLRVVNRSLNRLNQLLIHNTLVLCLLACNSLYSRIIIFVSGSSFPTYYFNFAFYCFTFVYPNKELIIAPI